MKYGRRVRRVRVCLADVVKRTIPLQVVHSAELEELQRLLHFPEEVALRLANTENELFYQVPPIDYLRQVTLDLGGTPPHLGDTPRASVRTLVKRFNEVSLFNILLENNCTFFYNICKWIKVIVDNF